MLTPFQRAVSVFALFICVFTVAHQAWALDLYANSISYYTSQDLLAPEQILGEPDSVYADFRDKDTYVMLDMGRGEEGRDGLTLFVYPLEFGASVVVTFYDENEVVLGSANTVFVPGAREWTAVYWGTEPYRFVRIASPEEEQWRLDAVQASAINTPVAEPAEDEIDVPGSASGEEASLASNTLIKLANNDAVYVIGADGKRHPFPNEITFFSWGYAFEDVEIVDAETMATYYIGDSVTIKPDTYLVKLQTVPKVYAVAPGRTLRWIPTEELAASIYGPNWAKNVIDVSDAFWPDYLEGSIVHSVTEVENWEAETQPF